MRITVAGIGYVGLVTGTCLAEVGHQVKCIDVDQGKIDNLNLGIIPIYEPGLEELVIKNMNSRKLKFTTDKSIAYTDSEIIIIAVGTPEQGDGKANLTFIQSVAKDIGCYVNNDVTVVTKSTIPVGTNYNIKKWIEDTLQRDVKIDIVSNPEFLREGSAITDTFKGDRIVIGSDTDSPGEKVEEMYKPFNIPTIRTNIKSAEMIKYAANAFLATKISFINEIASICEKVGADIQDVAEGIGRDKRIGSEFLNAGIGYGGSCFPKDTKALVQIAGHVEHDFELLEAVIQVNNNQQIKLVDKAKQIFGPLRGKKVALLGLSFKANTDDIRESASILMAKRLIAEGSSINAYDPIAIPNTKLVLGDKVSYFNTVEDALKDVDLCLIGTDWDQIKGLSLQQYKYYMKTPYIFDGRNCFSIQEAEETGVHYFSIGRRSVTFMTECSNIDNG